MKKSAWVALAATLALCMVVSSSAAPSLAYLTTYTEARGTVEVTYDTTDVQTRIDETVQGWDKTVDVTNTSDTMDCFVRVKAFAGSGFTLTYNAGGAWTDGGDGYWYYNAVLPAGATTTTPLMIHITGPAELPEQFDVTVVQECAPVIYAEDGTATADWNLTRTPDPEVSEEPQPEESPAASEAPGEEAGAE